MVSGKDINMDNIMGLMDLLKTVQVENDIHGWFDFDGIYYDMVFKAQDNAKFVEVGSWLGKSACYMGALIKISKKNIRFDCVDVWSDFAAEGAYVPEINDSIASGISMIDKFKNNMKNAGITEYVNPIKSWSWEAAASYEDNSLDFVFLDAAHDYDSVKKDLEAWWPKVNGYFGGHDYNNSPHGVQMAVNEFFYLLNIKVNVINGSWLVEKII